MGFVNNQEKDTFPSKKVLQKFSGLLKSLYLCIRFRPKNRLGSDKERVL